MQHLDNDMDDLFQRAAENYPLRIDNGDWEAVARKIANIPVPSNITVPPPKKGNRKIIILAVLLLVLPFGWYIFKNSTNNISRKADKGLIKYTDTLSGKREATIDFPGLKAATQENNILTQDTARNKRRFSFSAVIEATPINTNTRDAFAFATKAQGGETPKENTPLEKGGKGYDNYYAYFLSPEDVSRQESEKLIEGSKNSIEATLLLAKKFSPLIKDVPVVEKNPDVPIKKNDISLDRKHGLYFGVIAGPDLSKVHSSPFKFGFDVGLLFGYKINPNLSFETGLIKGRKNYTSDGSNFNMGKIRQSMPAGMTIDNLASQSNLIEIPLKVKYNFTAKKSYQLFVTGGLSSYIMTKEKNMYNASINGNTEKLKGVYYENNYRFPANATISAGYEHGISRYLDFRIEPYLKIPLQGIGVGSLPLTSAGLQVGITRRLK